RGAPVLRPRRRSARGCRGSACARRRRRGPARGTRRAVCRRCTACRGRPAAAAGGGGVSGRAWVLQFITFTGSRAGPPVCSHPEGCARRGAVLKHTSVLQDSVSPSLRFSVGILVARTPNPP